MKKSEEPRIITCERCEDRGWYTEKIEEGRVDVWFCDCAAYEKLSKMLERCKNK